MENKTETLQEVFDQVSKPSILNSMLEASNERVNRTNNLIIRLKSLTRRIGLESESPQPMDGASVERVVQPVLEELRLSFYSENEAIYELEKLVAELEQL